MKDLFKSIILDFLQREFNDVLPRNYEIPLDITRIVSIIGARRTGKTYLLFSLIKQLRKTVPRENLVYLNLEDDRLFPVSNERLSLFIESYFELYPAKKNEQVYFFFDEIQNADNWEIFIRRIYDTENCRIYLTGSSSKMLSKDLATSLRGRSLHFAIYPLSFKEYLGMKGIALHENYSSQSKAEIAYHFDHYLSTTAFPELIDFPKPLQFKALHDYFDLIIYKDLIERYHISNHVLVKHFVRFLLANMSNPVSINKCYNDFKSQGLTVAKNTLFQYLDYLSEAFIVFPVEMYTDNLREKRRNPSKVYSVDIGLNYLFTNTLNIGRVYENTVFLELCRRFESIHYYKGKQEVDFVASGHSGIILYNVAYEIENEKTLQREINGLAEAMHYLGLKESFLINYSLEKKVALNGYTIHILPLWKWLLM